MLVRVGFIGAGNIARSHLRDLEQLTEKAEVAGAFDVVRENADRLGQQYGCPVYDSAASLARNVDAVYICLPPFAHGEAEQACIEAKKPFLVEKPVALSLAVAREIEQGVERAGLITSVGYHWRYSMPISRAKDLLNGAAIGMVLGYWMGSGPRPGATLRPGWWWGVEAKSGGQIVEQTTHIIDSARYLAGEVVSVYANLAQRAMGEIPGFDAPDVGVATLRFESGAVGVIVNSCMLPRGGTVGIHVVAQGSDRLVLEAGLNGLKVIEGDRITEYPVGQSGFQQAFLAEDTAFIDAVATGDPSAIRSTYANGVRSLSISLAAVESARTGRPVSP